ncbi:hypothetical protein YC2023_082888 [Brassica napus]
MARKSGSKVVATLEAGIRNLEAGTRNPEAGFLRGTTPMEFDEYSNAERWFSSYLLVVAWYACSISRSSSSDSSCLEALMASRACYVAASWLPVVYRSVLVGGSRWKSSILGNMEDSPYQQFAFSLSWGRFLEPIPGYSILGTHNVSGPGIQRSGSWLGLRGK